MIVCEQPMSWAERSVTIVHRHDLWTILILVFWCPWRHRNDDSAKPSHHYVNQMIRSKVELKKLTLLFTGEAFGFRLPTPEWLLQVE